MDNRKWQANAAASPPTAPVSPSTGYPTNGNVSVAPTTPGDWWYHMIGEELRSVIVAAGLTPTHNLVNQLLAALNGGWGMAKSLGTTGYITLPGGLIMQWGAGSTTGTGYIATAYPIAFPTSVFRVLLTDSAGSLAQTHVVAIDGINSPPGVANFSTYVALPTTQAGASSSFFWLALGN